jgi:hypothetical protein
MAVELRSHAQMVTQRSPGQNLPVWCIAAFIDTGAQFSVISKRAAAALGITDPLLAHDPAMTVHGATAEQLDGRVHRFSLLAIGAATAAGASLAVNADRLSVTAPHPLPAELVEALRRSKPDILRLLSTDRVDDDQQMASDDTEWWFDLFNERAAHRECDGGYSRAEAEQLAFGEMLLEWHRRHGARPDPHRCAGCDDELPSKGGLTLCDGAVVHFDAVRGVDCIVSYGRKWRGAAAAALNAIGICPPKGFDPPL